MEPRLFILAALPITRTHVGWAAALLGGVSLILVLVMLVRWRWGQAKALAKNPLSKYVVLSVAAHLALAVAAYFARVIEPPAGGSVESTVVVQLVDDFEEEQPIEAPSPAAAAAQAPELANEPPHTMAPSAETTPPPIGPPPSPLTNELAEVSRYRDAEPLATLTPPVPLGDDAPPRSDSNLLEPATDPSDPSPLTTDPNPQGQPPPSAGTSTVADSPSQPFEPSARPTLDEPPIDDPAANLPTTMTATRNDAAADESTPVDDVSLKAQPLKVSAAAPNTQARTLQPISSRPPDSGTRPLRPVSNPWSSQSRGLPLVTSSPPRRLDQRPLPEMYRDRWASDREDLARARGGDADTEEAVAVALSWLAAVQNADGRWDASQFGGGGRLQEDGQDRGRAGLNADTGISGLALLAFMGAGHTQSSGTYQETVRRGLDFLSHAQRSRTDGSLVGEAGDFAAMYCHGIATLALSEAYAVTGDAGLGAAVRRAIAFTIAAQDPATGGWRYRPGQAGDTSQLGWQLLGLTSSHYAGVPIPQQVWTGAGRFLESVAWGAHGGLASYRPGHRPSTSMTAEALLCRLLLRTPGDHPSVREAADYLVRDLPGRQRVDYYYWYYATLALFHLQDEHWSVWNAAVKPELLTRQRRSGSLAGSWDADSRWGPSGGRAYTTALATLTLEVYYRYRPLHAPRGTEQTAWRTRR